MLPMSSSPRLSSANNNSVGVSNISTQIESLEQRLTPIIDILESSNKNKHVEQTKSRSKPSNNLTIMFIFI